MISYDEALTLLTSLRRSGHAETVPLAEAAGRIAAETLSARNAVPAFANSAMDGFALRAEATFHAPVTLPVSGQVFAGDIPGIAGRDACAIATGAPLPSGFDAVVPFETVDIAACDAAGQPEAIRIGAPVRSGRNVRLPGEDFQAGDILAVRGTRLTAFHLMALAAGGVADVPVASPIRVTVFTTGREVMEDPREAPAPGRIHDANTPFLLRALEESGAKPVNGGCIADDAADFRTRLMAAMHDTDLFVSTGAVSEGLFDFIPEALAGLGADILFRKVAVRPGKPVLFARLPNGVPFLGLPGNPASAAAGLRFFAAPLLRHLREEPPEPDRRAILENDAPRKKGLRFFLKAVAAFDETCTLRVRVLDGQESFRIMPLTRANCWVILEEGDTPVKAGTVVRIAPLLPGGSGPFQEMTR